MRMLESTDHWRMKDGGAFGLDIWLWGLRPGRGANVKSAPLRPARKPAPGPVSGGFG